ncbi:MAG TPA: hypothetical protein VFI47_25815 [Acidimicrobiales bacterium]|nr:hypothetical protein [Acidimicrobiales bacterium]
MSEVTVGIDIGTTSVVAVAAAGDGTVLARTRVPHDVRTSQPGSFEHDRGQAWRAGVLDALDRVASAGRAGGPLPRGRRRGRGRLLAGRDRGRPGRRLGAQRCAYAARAADGRRRLGLEPPVIGAGLGAAAVLAPGTVLAVTGWMAEEGAGGVLHRDLVLVTAGEPRLLTEDE